MRTDLDISAPELHPNIAIVYENLGNPQAILKLIVDDKSISGDDVRLEGQIAFYAKKDSKTVQYRRTTAKDFILLGNIISDNLSSTESFDQAVMFMEEKEYDKLKDFQGVFVLLIIDWERQSVSIASDLLGIKPFYYAKKNATLILSDRAEIVSKYFGSQIDAIGFSSWLYFGSPLVNRTIYDSVFRVSPGAVTIFESSSQKEITYWQPLADEKDISEKHLEDLVAHEFSNSVQRLLSPYEKATVFLSGGFDSRFALLSALKKKSIPIDAVSIPYTHAEQFIVEKLSKMAGVELQLIDIRGSLWDEFDSMWFYHNDGFPITKNLTYLGGFARGFKDVYMDGSIASVSMWCHSSDPPTGPPKNEEEANQFVWKSHAKACLDECYKKEVSSFLYKNARYGAYEQSKILSWDSKFCFKWDMYQDERRYTPVNFLQYSNFTYSLHPFYDKSMIETRLKHPNRLFNKQLYQNILKKQFPGPGDLPHASDITKGFDSVYAFSKVIYKQLPEVVSFVIRNRFFFNTNWILPRLATYGIGWRKHMYVIMHLMRLMEMEREMRRQNIAENLSEVLFNIK